MKLRACQEDFGKIFGEFQESFRGFKTGFQVILIRFRDVRVSWWYQRIVRDLKVVSWCFMMLSRFPECFRGISKRFRRCKGILGDFQGSFNGFPGEFKGSSRRSGWFRICKWFLSFQD